MNLIRTILGYLKWHYGKALFSTFKLWKNLLYFLVHYFSLKSLFTNFFTPWKRLTEGYPAKFNLDKGTLEKYFSTFLVNTIMRIFGMLFRTFAIIIGISCCLSFILILPLTLGFWLFLPILIFLSILLGLILILFSF
jgi:hypothetical protein